MFQDELNGLESEVSKYFFKKGTQNVDPLERLSEHYELLLNIAGLVRKY